MVNVKNGLRLSALDGTPNMMNYAALIYMRRYKYETWKKVATWAYANLSHNKDFAYSNEVISISGEIYEWPMYFWMAAADDFVALKLAINLE